MTEVFLTQDYRNSIPKQPTHIWRTLTETVNTEDPMRPVYSSGWPYYTSPMNGTLPPVGMRLPASLFVVCKSVPAFERDFYLFATGTWMVSERFFKLIKENRLLEDTYEESALTLLSDKGDSISSKNYYLLRFYKCYDDRIDFSHSPRTIMRKKRPGLPRVYYQNIVFKPDCSMPAMFHLTEHCFQNTFFVNQELRNYMEEEQFMGFEFYTPEAYATELLSRHNKPRPTGV